MLAVSLHINHFRHTLFSKQVMTAPDTALKPQPLQHPAKIIKADRRISRATQNALKRLIRAHATIVDVPV